jgi:predicted nucleic acid-binding protein
MVLVDTSVWIEHLRSGDETLVRLLEGNQVLTHPFVIGEIASGNLADRDEILSSLMDLPDLSPATESEALYFLERNRLMGRGIDYIDVHLLAAAALAPPARLWTRDQRLEALARGLDLSWPYDQAQQVEK